MYQQMMYTFVLWAVDMIKQPAIWYIAGPLITLRVILRFLRWSFSTARGERDSEELSSSATENAYGLENRLNYGRSYRHLRGSGFSDGELHRIRGGRSRFRF